MQQNGLFTSAPIAQAPVARATVEDAVLLSAVGLATGSISTLAASAWVAGYPVKPVLAAWGKTAAWAVSGHAIWPEQGPVVSHWLMSNFGFDALIPAAVAGFWLAWMGWKAGYRVIKPGVRESGHELVEYEDASGFLAKDIKKTGAGLWLSNSMQAGLERFFKSILILGSPGGGKTVAILYYLSQFWKAGYRTLVIDGPKGDFSRVTPDALIMGVTYDGPAMDIGRDLPDRGSIIEFVSGLIEKDPSQPIWGGGARMFLITIFCSLQDEFGTNWGWKQVKERLFLSISEVKALAEKHYTPAVAILDEESKTAQSIHTNYAVAMANIWELCIAWENKTELFSIVEWYLNDRAVQKNLILQVDGRYKEISGAFCSAVFRLLSGLTISPILAESKYRENPTPLAIVVDELAQLGKLDLAAFMEAGRSKEVFCVLATQTTPQIETIYSKAELASWLGMVGTKVFGQVLGPEKDFVLQIAGKSIYWIPSETISTGPTGGVSRSVSYQKDERPVIDPDRLGQLGKREDKKGVDLLFLLPEPVIDYVPFTNLPELRPSYVPNPDFGRSVPKMAEAALIPSYHPLDTGNPASRTHVIPAPMADLEPSTKENPDSIGVAEDGHALPQPPEPVSGWSPIPFIPGMDTDETPAAQEEEPILEHAAEDATVSLIDAVTGVDLHLVSEIVSAVEAVKPQPVSRADHARQLGIAQKQESLQKIIAAKKSLLDQGKPATQKAIAELAGVSEKTVSRLLAEAEE